MPIDLEKQYLIERVSKLRNLSARVHKCDPGIQIPAVFPYPAQVLGHTTLVSYNKHF